MSDWNLGTQRWDSRGANRRRNGTNTRSTSDPDIGAGHVGQRGSANVQRQTNSRGSYGPVGAGEIVEPAVNELLVQQLMEMGFSRNRAVRSLHFGGPDVNSAVSWVVEHEDDPGIDDELLVSVERRMTEEEVWQRAQDLRTQAKLRREREEKELQKTRELERIRAGKETQSAAQRERERTRQKYLEEKKKEKLEEQRARELVRVKLEEDRRRRRRKQGLPEELTAKEKAVLEEKRRMREAEEAEKIAEDAKFAKSVGTLSELRELLVEMKHASNDEAAFKTACTTLLKYLGNVARDPDEGRFRRIRLANAVLQERVARVRGGIEFLEMCGFKIDADGEFLCLPREVVNRELLSGVGLLLDSALKNPFFGSL